MADIFYITPPPPLTFRFLAHPESLYVQFTSYIGRIVRRICVACFPMPHLSLTASKAIRGPPPLRIDFQKLPYATTL